jgi:TRAP-type C4-dicarboxylate transport system permease small subunit
MQEYFYHALVAAATVAMVLVVSLVVVVVVTIHLFSSGVIFTESAPGTSDNCIR